MSLTPVDFDYVRRLVYDRSAIVLEQGKEYLAELRLLPVARQAGFGSLQELVQRLQSDRHSKLHQQVVEAMTTNETTFFRDLHPFAALRQSLLPELLERRAGERQLQIWCAACSSGQEPYSIALLLHEHFPQLAAWTVRILATDLSREMLERARLGCFSQLEVNRGLPAPLLVKHFTRNGTNWQIKEEFRRRLELQQINLAEPFPALPQMDVIMMRNVLIYFDVETKRAILGRLRRVLRPDGYLFLGGAESTLNLDEEYERVQIGKTACYRLRGR